MQKLNNKAAVAKTTAAPLTSRQMQVLHLAAWGYPNKVVAALLGITLKTVEKHRTQAYARLGVNCIQRVIIAMRYRQGRDLLGEPPPTGKKANGARIILRGDHPRAGQCGTIIKMGKANGNVHPRVRLDTGEEVVVSSISQMG